MEYKSITYVPGFYKIFDEILVNAAGGDATSNRFKIEVVKLAASEVTKRTR